MNLEGRPQADLPAATCPRADVGHAPQEAQMSTGDERLDAVEDRIDEAKEAADRVEDLSLIHI